MYKSLTVAFCAVFLSGCVSSMVASRKDHGKEELICVDVKANQMKMNTGFKLVFFARNFGGNVQVWLNPNNGRTVVTKTMDMSQKTCYVFEGFPTSVYTPYDKSVEEINNTLKPYQ